jgi:DNA-binding transcriptional MerR regulator
MLIGELSAKTGFSHDTIRYYEKIGLIRLERRARRINGFKEYPEHLVERLRFIGQAKAMGFTLSELREMFQLKDGRELSCEDMEEWADEKLEQLEERIAELRTAHRKLKDLRESKETNCSRDQCHLEESEPFRG